jgi:formylglycine-generating enzyme required for sulfatase activity
MPVADARNVADGKKGKGTPEAPKGRVPPGFVQEGTDVDAEGRAKRIRHVKTGIVMVLVPGGTFTMGSRENDAEKPLHNVTVKPFYLAETEVTLGQWTQFEAESTYHALSFAGKAASDSHPVAEVSFEDCQEFCKHFAQDGIRLPSEAEWEFAARGGSNTRWAHGDDENRLAEFAWFAMNSGNAAHPVREKKPNAFGLYDMAGNLWEWCEDTWHNNYSGAPRDGSAWVDMASSFRVFRGGSFGNAAGDARPASRSRSSPGFRNAVLGFRPARSSP